MLRKGGRRGWSTRIGRHTMRVRCRQLYRLPPSDLSTFPFGRALPYLPYVPSGCLPLFVASLRRRRFPSPGLVAIISSTRESTEFICLLSSAIVASASCTFSRYHPQSTYKPPLSPSQRVTPAHPHTKRQPNALRSTRRRSTPSLGKASPQTSPTMPREGTRSQTGNSRPRIFQAIDTGPATPRRKPSLKSRLTPGGAAKPAKGKKDDKRKEKQKSKKAGAGTGGGSGGGGLVDRVKSAVGLAPREPKRVQKKGGVRRAVQKVSFVFLAGGKENGAAVPCYGWARFVREAYQLTTHRSRPRPRSTTRAQRSVLHPRPCPPASNPAQ